MKPRKRLIGRRRWAKVVRFLETTMEQSKSERTRMQAAMRLVDVLTLREQREQVELRRNTPAKPAGDATPEPGKHDATAPVETEETRDEDSEIDAAVAFIRQGAKSAE